MHIYYRTIAVKTSCFCPQDGAVCLPIEGRNDKTEPCICNYDRRTRQLFPCKSPKQWIKQSCVYSTCNKVTGLCPYTSTNRKTKRSVRQTTYEVNDITF